MTIKRTKVNTQIERQILTGVIVSDRFLKDILPLYSPDLMEIKFSPIIMGWCKNHFEKYEKAPKELIKDIYLSWDRNEPNQEQSKFIGSFLSTLSEEFEHAEKFNAEYLMDKAVFFFKKRSMKNLSDDLKYHLDKDDVITAEQVMSEFHKVEKVMSKGIDIFEDVDALKRSFEENYESLFTIPGALGKMMTPQMTRNSFVCLMGPEKRGKSWWLQYLGMQAHRARCNVAEFQVGDMSEEQRIRRQYITLAKCSDKPQYCGPLLMPILDCDHNQHGRCVEGNKNESVYDGEEKLTFEDCSNHEVCTECQGKKGKHFKGAIWHTKTQAQDPLTWRKGYQVKEAYNKRNRPKQYKLFTYSAGSCSVTDIRNQLEFEERVSGFVPDVIIIDYIGLLATEPKAGNDFRHNLNETNKALRRLSQDLHCCLITAIQADAASYYQKSLTKANFSEDKRIFGHVTAMFALNQTVEEKKEGVMRIAPLVIREDAYDESYNVTIGQCLAIGQPYLFSF